MSYGVATSTEVAYFTYIYARVPAEHYQAVTSFTRAALLFGRFLSGVLSQLLIGLNLTGVLELNYISLAMVTVATILSFLLPPVTNTLYFHTENAEAGCEGDKAGAESARLSWAGKFRKAFLLLWGDFVRSFSDLVILKWSVWWALAMCGNFQVKLGNQYFSVSSNPPPSGWELHTATLGGSSARG